MSQSVHPLDDDLIDFEIAQQRLRRHLGRDGEYCAEDRGIITDFRLIHGGVGEYRGREVAGDAFKRNGPTRHTQSLFKQANVKLAILEREDNIRVFPARDDDFAG